jgi:hypothetical protein
MAGALPILLEGENAEKGKEKGMYKAKHQLLAVRNPTNGHGCPSKNTSKERITRSLNRRINK